MDFVWEHNGNDSLLYSVKYVGAYTRGATLQEALIKVPKEIESYTQWAGLPYPSFSSIDIVQEKESELEIADADSDVLLDIEQKPLSFDRYQELKQLVLKSASDLTMLYNSIPDKHSSYLPERKTFYGAVPRTAEEMFSHVKRVNAYYFGELGVENPKSNDLYAERVKGFEAVERAFNFPASEVFEGSYGEYWSLRKVMRRFIWHDRIHAKAMYRMALKTFPDSDIVNPFMFNV